MPFNEYEKHLLNTLHIIEPDAFTKRDQKPEKLLKDLNKIYLKLREPALDSEKIKTIGITLFSNYVNRQSLQHNILTELKNAVSKYDAKEEEKIEIEKDSASSDSDNDFEIDDIPTEKQKVMREAFKSPKEFANCYESTAQFIKMLNAFFSKFPDYLFLLNSYPQLIKALTLDFTWIENSISDFIDALLNLIMRNLAIPRLEKTTHRGDVCAKTAIHLWDVMNEKQKTRFMDIAISQLLHGKSPVEACEFFGIFLITHVQSSEDKENIYKVIMGLLEKNAENAYAYVNTLGPTLEALFDNYPAKQGEIIKRLLELSNLRIFATAPDANYLFRCRELALNTLGKLFPKISNKNDVINQFKLLLSTHHVQFETNNKEWSAYYSTLEAALHIFPHLNSDPTHFKDFIFSKLVANKQTIGLLQRFYPLFGNYQQEFILRLLLKFRLSRDFLPHTDKDFMHNYYSQLTEEQQDIYFRKLSFEASSLSYDKQNLNEVVNSCVNIFSLINKLKQIEILNALLNCLSGSGCDYTRLHAINSLKKLNLSTVQKEYVVSKLKTIKPKNTQGDAWFPETAASTIQFLTSPRTQKLNLLLKTTETQISDEAFFEAIKTLEPFDCIPKEIFTRVSEKAQDEILQRLVKYSWSLGEDAFSVACHYYLNGNENQKSLLLKEGLFIEKMKIVDKEIAEKVFNTLDNYQLGGLQRRLHIHAYQNMGSQSNFNEAMFAMHQIRETRKQTLCTEKINVFEAFY